MFNKRGLFHNQVNDDEDEILIYDVIGADFFGFGITAQGIHEKLGSLSAGIKKLRVKLNSPGGDVFEGVAIYNELVQFGKDKGVEIVTEVMGLAASAASLIAMAGDQRKIAENGSIMIHKAWTVVLGNETELMKMADTLGKIDDTLVNTYARRTKRNRQKIKKWMEDETWFMGQEAVDEGFADEMMEAKTPPKASGEFGEMVAKFAAKYRNAPDWMKASVPTEPKDEETPVEDDGPGIIDTDFDEINNLRNRLSLVAARGGELIKK